MAERLAILGQARPAANAVADLYSPPSAAVLSCIVIACTGGASSVRMYARKAGQAAAVGNAMLYDFSTAAGELVTLQLGITLAVGETLSASSTTGDVTFHVFGSEL